MVIEVEAPGTPDVLVTSTPATRPDSELMKFSRCVWAISGPPTVCCEVPCDRSTAVCPSAVTTTASRLSAARRSCTLMTTSVSLTVRSASSVPIIRNCRTWPTSPPIE